MIEERKRNKRIYISGKITDNANYKADFEAHEKTRGKKQKSPRTLSGKMRDKSN